MTAPYDPLARYRQQPAPTRGGSLWAAHGDLVDAHNELLEGVRRNTQVGNQNLRRIGETLRDHNERLRAVGLQPAITRMLREDLNRTADRLERRVDLITRALVNAGLMDPAILDEPMWEGCPKDCAPDEPCEWCEAHPWGGCYVCDAKERDRMTAPEAPYTRHTAGIGPDDEPPGEARPGLAPVATMTAPDESAVRPLVRDLINRGQVVVLAAVEGLGKSTMRAELAIRGATGRGPVWGYFEVSEPFCTAIFDEENGTALELKYDAAILDYIGAGPADLGDRLHRASYAGLDLDNPEDRGFLGAQVERTAPDLLVLDTGGQMVADEWGSTFKTAMRYLRALAVRYGCAVLVVVHMTKPPRESKGTASTARRCRTSWASGHARPTS